MRTKYILLFAAVAGLGFSMMPQSLFLDYLTKRLGEYHQSFPIEKSYVQSDKTLYQPGDTVWYCAYLADGATHGPSPLSNVLYAELIDPRGSTVQRRTLKVTDGKAAGHFVVAHDMPGGIYKLKASTWWMTQTDNQLAFVKEIQVQKQNAPKLLWTLEFEKEAYGPGDKVSAKLRLRNLSGNPMPDKPLQVRLFAEGKQVFDTLIHANATGLDIIQCQLPPTLSRADALLSVSTDMYGQTQTLARAVPVVLNKIDLQFFPEGGRYIDGIAARVAFKAINEHGKPADVAGYIVNGDGKKVADFESFHNGMGAFNLTPLATQKYWAVVTKPTGITERVPLPAPDKQGLSMTVAQKNDDLLQLTLRSNMAETIHVVAQMHGKILFSGSYLTTQHELNIPLRSKQWAAGIVQITVFDDFETPVAERLVFVNPHKTLRVDVTTDKPSYEPREKVTMTLKATDANGNPVMANLSAAVVNDKVVTLANDKQDNILTALWLSSELKGKIHEPSFYFNPNEPKADKALDYLMMTQGWRRFEWKTVLNGNLSHTRFPQHTEKIRGRVTNSKQEPIRAKVVIAAPSSGKLGRLTTSPSGLFEFEHEQQSPHFQIYAKAIKSNHIRLYTSNPAGIQPSATTQTTPLHEMQRFEKPVNIRLGESQYSITLQNEPTSTQQDIEITAAGKKQTHDGASFTLTNDTQNLSEVVTIGYGTQRRELLTASVTTITNNETIGIAISSIDDALQGRVAGLDITNAGTPGSNASVKIRGTASVGTNQPLYLVDGLPTDNISMLSPNEVSRIEVIKDATATAIYGSRAANGVISITTRSGHWDHYRRRRQSSKTARRHIYFPDVKFEAEKSFYVPKYTDSDTIDARTDRRETIYWNPRIVTNKQGVATVEFYNSDETTVFRATVEGTTPQGLAGRAEHTYHVAQRITLEATIPPYLTFNDELTLAVSLTNHTAQTVSGNLTSMLPAPLNARWPLDTAVALSPNETKLLGIPARTLYQKGKYPIRFVFTDGQGKTTYADSVEIVPKGFPASVSLSAKALDASFSFQIEDALPGSLHAKLRVYNNVIEEAMAGIESVLREPYGCFEQASAATYPNILILQYLDQSNGANAQLKANALKYIANGYRKLTAYECKDGGFEWFGHSPANEGLTAFGIMEFTEMAKVYDGVSKDMVARNLTWLLDRRDDKGGFLIHKGKYGFSDQSEKVTNAYIVFALSEAGVNANLYLPQLQKASAEAEKSRDAYRMALMANTHLNLGDTANAAKFTAYLSERFNKHGAEGLKAELSVVGATGVPLRTETVALAARALLRENKQPFNTMVLMMDYLFGQRKYGGFGSTQATILSLKAVMEFAKAANTFPEDGTLSLLINQKEVAKLPIKANGHELVVDSLERYLHNGMHAISLKFNGMTNPLPFTFDADWTTNRMSSSPASKLVLGTQLNAARAKVGDLVRMHVKLHNASSERQPMTLIKVGIPSGLSLQAWQLKKMQEERQFDFYEIHKNQLVLYYKEMGPNQTVQLNFDLKAEAEGVFTSPINCAYLYYNPEHVTWQDATTVRIEK